MIFLKFLLAIYILKHFSNVPPFFICLDHNSVWFDFLNKLLSSLGEHSRLISGTNKENLLSIESFSQVNKSAFKAVNSKNNYELEKKLTYRLFYPKHFHVSLQL